MTCSRKYASGGIETFFSRVAFAMNSRVGQPYCHCQKMCGRKITPAIAPPAQRCQACRARHLPDSTRPATTPNPRKSTLILFWRPAPATIPKSSQSRGSPVRSARATMSQSTAQKTRSNAFIER